MLVGYEKLSQKQNLSKIKYDLLIELTLLGTLITSLIKSDYSLSGVPLIISFYLWNREGKYRVPWLFAILTGFYILHVFGIVDDFIIQKVIDNFYTRKLWIFFGVFLASPFLLLYNGTKGWSSKELKWFYWSWYPFHMLLIYAVETVVRTMV